MLTILGGKGFIGSAIVRKMHNKGIQYFAPDRGEKIDDLDLGNIIYCIGLTSDFRSKPFETVEAHVCFLNKILNCYKFESLTYLSSTRVYINCSKPEVSENALIPINIQDPAELYTLTKLTGERLCLSSGRNVKIARLSNVYDLMNLGNNFLDDIVRQVVSQGSVKFYNSAKSSKDYIDLESVSELIINIAESGQRQIYNIASGYNISNEELISILEQVFEFKYEFEVNSTEIVFPKINIERIKAEFGYNPINIKDNILSQIKLNRNAKN